LKRLAGCIDRGLEVARAAWKQVGAYVQDLRVVAGILQPSDVLAGEEREAQFAALWQGWEASVDSIHQQFAKVMSNFEPGLFVGGKVADIPEDNLDLERWFKRPKGHERRIHGRRHVGVRLVQQGPTLMLALDAHVHHDRPFTVDDLEPYRHSRVPASQQEAIERGQIMRRARSRKKRPDLLADLEKRYLNSS
jgi:hypothetical protein